MQIKILLLLSFALVLNCQNDTPPLDLQDVKTDISLGDIASPKDGSVRQDASSDAKKESDSDASDLANDVVDNRPPHEKLLSENIGFGDNTTGGAGGPIVIVTTLDDDGPGSLREAATKTGAFWIRFEVSGVIALSSPIEVSSDKTIDGRGADITLTDGLFIQNGQSNVIINNLKLRNAPGDLIRLFNGSDRVWVHHCDLSEGGDGAFDATEAATSVTISYTHIFDHDKAMLIGAGSPEGDGSTMRWTGHHNWYEDCVQRLPFIRFGWAHSFNNLIEWRSGTAMNVKYGGQMLIENNILAPQTNVGHKLLSESEGRAAARLIGNLERPLAGDEIEYTEFEPDTVFDPSEFYTYQVEVADEALDQKIRNEAGWQNIPFPQ